MCVKRDNNDIRLTHKKITLNNLNSNLIKSCFVYCSIEDILSLSLVCKKFYEITKELDVIFKEKCELNFCSNYDN
jgi:hypothetical protein